MTGQPGTWPSAGAGAIIGAHGVTLIPGGGVGAGAGWPGGTTSIVISDDDFVSAAVATAAARNSDVDDSATKRDNVEMRRRS